ncbi:MAG: hypothetical protein R3F56_00575 [Planctomycetota bacterium]
MKILSLPLLLSLALAGCSSEAATNATNAASNAANAATGMASEMAGKLLEQVKTTLSGVTNVEQAKTAASSLESVVPKLGDAMKGLTGNLPASVTSAVDGVREQITRLMGMADIKTAIGPMLEKLTNLLPKK